MKSLHQLWLLFVVLIGLAGVSRGADFLDPDVAFRFSAQAAGPDAIEAVWKIAPGYYLYRDKFKFQLSGANLGGAQFPKAETKNDANFGTVEIYHHEVRVLLPVARTGQGAQSVKLTATYQGCAEAGLCYSPITASQEISLPAQTMAGQPPSADGGALGSVAALRALAGPADMGGFLPPDQAFRAQAHLLGAQRVGVDYKIAPTYYLYRDKLKFKVQEPSGVMVAQVETPAPDIKDDPNFGKSEVYHHDFSAVLTLSRALKPGETLSLQATYQGCSEKGVCYPPLTKHFRLAAAQSVTSAPQVPAAQTATSSAGAPDAAAIPAFAAAPLAAEEGAGAVGGSTGKIDSLLKSGGFWTVVAFFFGAGLLLALTPCVFPMIPILAGIIAGQRQLTKTRGFLLALGYVLGMAITYAVAGVIAGLSGSLLSAALQNPWVIGAFAFIFVLLAFSMFGFYDLQLPSFLQSKFSDASNRVQGGHLLGVFVMGALSAVIVGPCVAAPLAGALLYIGQTGNVWLGGTALFFMALGMGVPLILVGVSAGALLPKTGDWMDYVKHFFGVLLLAVALWLVGPFLSAWLNMLAWALLLITLGVYLRALDSIPLGSSQWRYLWKAQGVVALLAGIALLLGLFAGGRDILEPLAIYTAKGQVAATAPHLKFERVDSLAALNAKLAQAKAENRPVMLDFYADWCVSCKEMERFTFSDPKVVARFDRVVLLQADVTANNDADKALLKSFGLFGPPGMIFWRADGAQSPRRVIGYEAPARFLSSVDEALGS